MNPTPGDDSAILASERPDRSLWTYYWFSLLAFPPIFPVLVLPRWFRYHTMRYKFTDEGISMSWGLLFRREIIIHYARIQDIHLNSNLVERWLGLARVLIQTASGSASAEMTLEGFKNYEGIRDFLYSKMRGVKDHPPRSAAATAGDPALSAADTAELATTLRAVAFELRELRSVLTAEKKGGPAGGATHV